ncbi:MAG: NnrS family protein [Burkholderiales bacterium]
MKAIPIRVETPGSIAPKPPAARSGWHPRWLLAAPHRLGFFAGAVMLAGSALWWALVLLARAQGLSPAWFVSPPAAHALLMSLGFTPLFIVGFLFTAGPRWLGQPDVPARALLVPVLAMLAGWFVVWPGLHVHEALAGAGMAVVAAGWSTLCWRFITILRASKVPDRTHARVVALACLVGATSMWVAAAALATGHEPLLRAATQVALWCFVATVFAAVSHRMIPFFSAGAVPALDAWRPMALLWLIVGALWLEAPFAVAQLWVWPLPAVVRWVQVAAELPAAALLLWLAVRWGLVQSLKIRMLAMLHGGFAWLGIAFALSAVSHALMALSDDRQSLGLAPTHALTMGYLGATLFAMATRVSSGHSGRSLAADNTAWALYWVLQAAVALRLAAALWPAAATAFSVLAVLAWATAAMGWGLRYGNWFLRARVDGRPG